MFWAKQDLFEMHYDYFSLNISSETTILCKDFEIKYSLLEIKWSYKVYCFLYS